MFSTHLQRDLFALIKPENKAVKTSSDDFHDNQKPAWSSPYADTWGLGENLFDYAEPKQRFKIQNQLFYCTALLGQIITASLPVLRHDRVIGWVAIDTLLKEFLDEPTLLRPNELTYAFIIDDEGKNDY